MKLSFIGCQGGKINYLILKPDIEVLSSVKLGFNHLHEIVKIPRRSQRVIFGSDQYT